MKAEGGDSTQWKPRSNPWLIAATVALAAFMEVLDTSIANEVIFTEQKWRAFLSLSPGQNCNFKANCIDRGPPC
jgi:hypothetical protein